MAYNQIINLVFSIIWGAITLLLLHYVFFAFLGVVHKKKFPHTDVKNRYGIIIPARNEEAVVGGLIKCILHECDYPIEQLEIFVIAHNCSDKTAEVARSYGPKVHVYEYNNPKENTMGFAFKHLFAQIEKDFKTSSFDGFFIFNADNLLAKDYFTKMNDAFEYYHKEYAISSFRNSSNFNENMMSAQYGIYFGSLCFLSYRGLTDCGVTTRVTGCGYVVPSFMVKDGWNFTSLTEDMEFSSFQVLNCNHIQYCDEAIFYDEQPTSFKIMWRQRLRWAKGHLIISHMYFWKLFRNIFKKGNKQRFATFDMSTFCIPFPIYMVFLTLLQYILLLFSPLFGVSLETAFLFYDTTQAWWYNLFIATNLGGLFMLAKSIIGFYFGTLLPSFLTTVLGWKRFHASAGKKIGAMFLFPLFFMLQFILHTQAMFVKNPTWKTIPHTGNKS